MSEDIKIEFTAHAEEQLTERELDREIVLTVAREPEQIVYVENKPPVAQSRITFKGRSALLRVVFSDIDDTRWIITFYPTSQITRYWQEEVQDED